MTPDEARTLADEEGLDLVEVAPFEELADVYRVRAAAVDPEQAFFLYLTVAEVWRASSASSASLMTCS